MKKILFGLITTVMIGFVGNAQLNNPSNPKNEFDYVGRIHNEALLEIINSANNEDVFMKDSKIYCLNLLSKNKIDADGN